MFEGLGCLPGEYHIVIDPEISPVQEHPRWFSVVKKSMAKELLEDMLCEGIIARVTKPTPRINSWIVVQHNKKSGKILGCLDP